MRWYHFTGMQEFKLCVIEEALISLYERTRENVNALVVPRNISKRFGPAALIEELEQSYEFLKRDKPYEFARNNYIWFTQNNSVKTCKHMVDAILGFELPHPPNKGKHLILPKLTLDTLVDIGVHPVHSAEVHAILFTSHNGKYRNIPLYRI